jgi:hypothetical protein
MREMRNALKVLFGTSERNITTYHVEDTSVNERLILKCMMKK